MNEYSEVKNTNQNKSMAVTSTPVTPRRPVNLAIHESETPPPIPPRIDQTPETRPPYPSFEPPSVQSSVNPSQSDPRSSTGRTRYNPISSIPPPKPPHTREFSNASNSDENYKDSLRKAASSSVFDRYKMSPMSPQYSRQSSQNSQNQQLSNRSSNNNNFLQTSHNSSGNSHASPHYYSQDRGQGQQQAPVQYPRQGHNRINNQSPGQNGATAVVKPTIVHQGNVTFMEF